MKTREEKYLNDPYYYALVNMLRDLIRRAQFTPSELREASLFAAILEERERTTPPVVIGDWRQSHDRR